MIDTVSRIETPEGIDLAISPAGPIARGLALAIDGVIRTALTMAFGIGLSSLGQTGLGLLLVVYFVMEWFYPVLFEVLSSGRTPGKRSMGLRVVNVDGTPVGWGASVLRNLLRAVDLLPLFYIAGLVCMMCNSRFQRIGDLAAGTLVVTEDRPLFMPEAPSEVGAKVAPVALLADEQRAIVSFAERRADLSPQRAEELAGLVGNLTGKRGGEGATELLRFANGIAGKS